MSVREYIGARYVPIFLGTWNSAKEYEPLSVVLYQGNSFTSMQYVPAGVDINNEIYWAQTGNYNQQVQLYREEVLRYIAEVEGASKTVAINKYGNTLADYQAAANECANGAGVLVLTENITLGASEYITLRNTKVYGCGYKFILTPRDISNVPGTATAVEGIRTYGNCEVTGINFESSSIYLSYQAKNNGATGDKSSNRYAIHIGNGTCDIIGCKATNCGMVFNDGGMADIKFCEGAHSEMFVLNYGTLIMDSCKVMESTDTITLYYHAIYSPVAKNSISVRNCVFGASGTGKVSDVLHCYGNASADQNVVIEIDNCSADMCHNFTQAQYGKLHITNCTVTNCSAMISAGYLSNNIYISNCEFTQDKTLGVTQLAITSGGKVIIENSQLYFTTRMSNTTTFRNCKISGSYLEPSYSGSCTFNNCDFTISNNTAIAFAVANNVQYYYNCTFTRESDTDNMLFNDTVTGGVVAIGCTANGYTNIVRYPDRGINTVDMARKHKADTQYSFITMPARS